MASTTGFLYNGGGLKSKQIVKLRIASRSDPMDGSTEFLINGPSSAKVAVTLTTEGCPLQVRLFPTWPSAAGRANSGRPIAMRGSGWRGRRRRHLDYNR